MLTTSKIANSKKTVYHYDLGGRTLSEDDGSGNLIADYIYLEGKLVAKVATVPNITVTPTTKNYGDTYVNGTSAAQTFTVSNTATAGDLLIGTVSLAGIDPTQFSKTADTCSNSIVAGGNTCTIDVVFAPASAGAKSATLTIPSDDPDTASLTAALTGNAVNPLFTVTKDGIGGGTVSSNPAGINCGATCSSSFADGTLVTLQAIPDGDSLFTGWSGVCSGTGTCGISMNVNASVNATFDRATPVAQFSASAVSGIAPLTVNFTNQSLRANAWSWTFGDEGSATTPNPSHTYVTPGIYSVSLTVTNAVGNNTLTKDNLIMVGSVPVDGGIRIPRIPPVTYSSLQAAFDASQDGEAIQSQATFFTEELNFSRPISITLDGGYSPDYSSQPGTTQVTGTLTITDGSMTINNLVIQ